MELPSGCVVPGSWSVNFWLLFCKLLIKEAAEVNLFRPGWPRNRENREFGSYFFQTGKTQGILL